MAINQISTANTFEQWLIATQSLIAFANSISDFTSNSSNFIINGNLTVANTITADYITANVLLTAFEINTTSDVALKDNIIRISNSLDVLDKITGVEFTWKSDGNKSYGVSAQEIEEVLPEVVKTRSDGYKGVNYLNLIAFLIEAIKDLKNDVSEIKKQINIK